jgi:hypothetical protein
MGQHKNKTEFKGSEYKRTQRMVAAPKMFKQAMVGEKWLIKRGWVKNEEGKWVRS